MRNPEWWREGEYFTLSYLDEPTACANLRFVFAQCDFLERTLPSSRKFSILDSPCGVGQVSIEMRKRGHITTGVDINNQYLTLARKRASELSVCVPFILGDVRTLPFVDTMFDAVLSLGTSIGYFSTEEENLKVFKEMARVVKPLGKVLIETWTSDTKDEGEQEFIQKLSNGETVKTRSWSKNSRVYMTQERCGKIVAIDHQVYSEKSLQDICLSVGLRAVRTYYTDYWKWVETPQDESYRRVSIFQKLP
ncbi:MAG: class I SAM-dependent methyltransferase [bacterium]|nr:class I SAM-dependent methyltransferase [bacterium]